MSVSIRKPTAIPICQAESLHDRWVSIDKFHPGPVPVDHLIKAGTIRPAESYEQWLDYSAKRSRSTFQGARIEVDNFGNNRFEAKTTHVDSYSLWLHPKMVDFNRPITVITDGVTTLHTGKPDLLTALKSVERRQDWGLIYHATVRVKVSR